MHNFSIYLCRKITSDDAPADDDEDGKHNDDDDDDAAAANEDANGNNCTADASSQVGAVVDHDEGDIIPGKP